MSKSFTPQKRVSPILVAILLIAFLLSIASIFQGVESYRLGEPESGSFYITLGITTLALSSYVLFQTRKRILTLALKTSPVITTIVCEKCGLKNVRDFERGDYIFKEVEPCPKCNEKMVITAIYREVKEKGKKETRLG